MQDDAPSGPARCSIFARQAPYPEEKIPVDEITQATAEAADSGAAARSDVAARRRRTERPAGSTDDVVPLASMTSKQLVRRAKFIEAAIELIRDDGPDAVQMRDVAKRSGVSLATAYRYFRSKDHLLAAALEDWQERLTSRTLAAATRFADDAERIAAILDYLRRAQRAFYRNPEMTTLMLRMASSTDPDACAAVERMYRKDNQMYARLLQGFPRERITVLSFALEALLTNSLTLMLHGRMSLDQAQACVEWSARVLLNNRDDLDVSQQGPAGSRR